MSEKVYKKRIEIYERIKNSVEYQHKYYSHIAVVCERKINENKRALQKLHWTPNEVKKNDR